MDSKRLNAIDVDARTPARAPKNGGRIVLFSEDGCPASRLTLPPHQQGQSRHQQGQVSLSKGTGRVGTILGGARRMLLVTSVRSLVATVPEVVLAYLSGTPGENVKRNAAQFGPRDAASLGEHEGSLATYTRFTPSETGARKKMWNVTDGAPQLRTYYPIPFTGIVHGFLGVYLDHGIRSSSCSSVFS